MRYTLNSLLCRGKGLRRINTIASLRLLAACGLSIVATLTPASAQILFVTTSQTIEGSYDTITVGRDAQAQEFSGLAVLYADGIVSDAIAVFNTSSLSMTDVVAETVQAFAFSSITAVGGSINNAIGLGNSTFTITNGSLFDLTAYDQSAFTLNGGYAANSITAHGNSTVDIQDSGSSNSIESYQDSQITIQNGADSSSITARENSRISVLNGEVTDLTGTGNSTLLVSGGNIFEIDVNGNGTLDVSGGEVLSIYSNNLSTVTLSGGKIGDENAPSGPLSGIQAEDRSVVNITGRAVNNVIARETSTINLTDGSVNWADIYNNAAMSVTGGTVTGLTVNNGSMLTLAGGNVGGIDPDLATLWDTGIYLYGSSTSLRLFGSGFALEAQSGNFYTLTGTLLDGSALNTTLYLEDVNAFLPAGGGSQGDPVLPDVNPDGSFSFESVPSGAWFDPPLAEAFDFEMTDGNYFTDILDFPSLADADGLYTVSIGDQVLGEFSSGTSLNFAEVGFTNVTAFTISGIDPLVDSEDPQAFPVQLAFSSPTASFKMTAQIAAPEPGTLALIGAGLLAIGQGLMRRRPCRDRGKKSEDDGNMTGTSSLLFYW